MEDYFVLRALSGAHDRIGSQFKGAFGDGQAVEGSRAA
jgi:hypothetical protein